MAEKIGAHYNQVKFTEGPMIYSSAELYDKIFEMSDFSTANEHFVILDAMCGSGLVGKEISKRLRNARIDHTAYFFDLAEQKMKDLAVEGYSTFVSDARHMPLPKRDFDRIYARFSVKNCSKSEQSELFKNTQRILQEDGMFVLIDMVAPEDSYEFMQQERLEKNKYTGMEGCIPHIPTLHMWYELLDEGGLRPKKVDHYVSSVSTSDWVKSAQMSPQDLLKMNTFLLSAPQEAKKSLNIREENGIVKIDYPVAIISSVPYSDSILTPSTAKSASNG